MGSDVQNSIFAAQAPAIIDDERPQKLNSVRLTPALGRGEVNRNAEVISWAILRDKEITGAAAKAIGAVMLVLAIGMLVLAFFVLPAMM